MKFRSKIDELLEQLQKGGEITQLTDEEVMAIDEHISKDMRRFRQELRRKEAQSEVDLAKIILNA